MSQDARAKAKFWGTSVPPGLQHGRNTHAYKAYGCACEVCQPDGPRRKMTPGGATSAARNRKLKRTKAGKPVPESAQHGVYAYRVYRCRCDVCTAANRARSDGERNAWRKTATGRWDDRADGMTVLHWPPVGHGIWTCPDCGLQLRHRAPMEEQTRAA